MFGHMKAQPILTLRIGHSLEEALARLIEATEGAQVVRWVEFPAAILLFLAVDGDSQSGAFYVLDRKVGTWFWVDFEDDQYGGYSVGDFVVARDERLALYVGEWGPSNGYALPRESPLQSVRSRCQKNDLRLPLATMPRRPLKCRVFCRIAMRQRISFREPWAQRLSLSSDSDCNRCQVENGVDSHCLRSKHHSSSCSDTIERRLTL